MGQIIKKREIEYQKKKKKSLDIKTLEDFYINGTINDLIPVLNNQKDKVVHDMIDYAEKHIKPTKFDKDGKVVATKVEYNPIVISNTFFYNCTFSGYPLRSQFRHLEQECHYIMLKN